MLKNESLADTTSEVSDNSILQDNPIVNTKSALSSKSTVSAPSAKENSVFDDKQRKGVIRALSNITKQNGVARLDRNDFVTDMMGMLETALDTGIISKSVKADKQKKTGICVPLVVFYIMF